MMHVHFVAYLYPPVYTRGQTQFLRAAYMTPSTRVMNGRTPYNNKFGTKPLAYT